MSFANPTGLNVGATGSIHTWKVRVAGRMVLGVEVEGETYYWNEFHLIGETGNTGTLVFEDGEQGPEWKLFRMFEPAQPLTAREAATKKVGDLVNLDGTPRRITLVDESRVHHIEGEAPEGTQVGDVAHYFNADTGQRMLVASWTGDEIEFYEGEDLPRAMIVKAFGIDAPPRSPETRSLGSNSGARPSSSFSRVFTLVALGLILVALVLFFSCSRTQNRTARTAPPPARQPAPAVRLVTGASGRLGTASYAIAGASVVELARVTGRRDVREYQLTGDGAEPRILVQGLNGGPLDWHLFSRVNPPATLTPYEAAALRKNAWLTLGGGDRAQVTDLFRAHTLSRDSTADALSLSGAVRYGFIARTASDVLIARWDETQLQLLRGVPYAERDILAAFAQKQP